MVIGDARTQTYAISQPPPDAPRPKLIGLLNGPIPVGRHWFDPTLGQVITDDATRVLRATIWLDVASSIEKTTRLLMAVTSHLQEWAIRNNIKSPCCGHR